MVCSTLSDEIAQGHGKFLSQAAKPEPNAEAILAAVANLKSATGASRAFVLIDYLQVWPIPEEMSRNIRSDLEADKWRIGEMKRLRDALDSDPILVISEARKPQQSTKATAWGGDLADVMGSARACYTPDMVFIFRPFTDTELAEACKLRKGKEKKADPKEVAQARERLRQKGLSYNKLIIAKGRDGVTKGDLDLTFHYRQARFDEGVSEDGTEIGWGPED
jgi:hypothetical protein